MVFKRLLFLLLISAAPAFAQGQAYENILITTSTANNPNKYLSPVTNATITVCSGVHTEIPCTPAVTIYSDVAMTIPITPPLTTSPLGNYRFVVAAGTYSVSFTGPGISTSNDVITLGGSLANGVTTTGSPANGNLAQFSGTTTITNGNLSGDCTTAGALVITCATAGNLRGTPALPNGTTATTQSLGDNTAKLATDAFVVANGTGTGQGASPVMAFYLSPQCPATNTSQCFQSPANTQQANDCSWIATNVTITCGSSHFVSADVGKQVMGWDNCNASSGNSGSLQMGLNPITAGAAVTIATFVSGTSVTLSTGAANTVTGNTHCFIWGTPDDAAAVLVEAAYDVAAFCPKLMLAAANFWFNDPHFTTQPTACKNLGVNFTPSNVGNVFYSAGFELEGRGMGTTNIYLGTNFPATSTCVAQDSAAVGTGKACFLLQVGAKWEDFSITGGSNATPAMANEAGTGRELIETISENTIENVMLTNFGAFDSTHTPNGIYSNYQLQLKQVDNSGFGYNGLEVASGRGASTAIMLAIENSLNTDLAILGPAIAGGYSFICVSCNFFGQYTTFAGVDVFNAGGSFICSGCLFHNGLSQTGAPIMYEATSSGSTAYLLNSQMTNTSAITGANGIKCTAACTNYLQNTQLTAGATGNTYKDVVNSKLFDGGGITGYAAGGGISLSGQIFNESNSVNFVACTAGAFVLSAGWGSTAAITAPTGGTAPCSFTITNSGTGQGASPTIAYTFPNPYMISPITCTALQIGGNNPTNTFTSSSLSATGVTFTSNITPTVNDTEIVQVTCVAP